MNIKLEQKSSDEIGVLTNSFNIMSRQLSNSFKKIEIQNEELQSTNEELQNTTEELQSTNEELQTTNEELQSSNEELQNTTEELHASNEELILAQSELETLNKNLELIVQERTKELQIKDMAIEKSINAVVFVNIQGEIIYANDSFIKMWGYDRKEEIYGKSPLEFHPAEESEKILNIFDYIISKGGLTDEIKAKKKNGNVFDVRFSASLIKNENSNSICIMSSYENITARKCAEEQFKKSSAEFASINMQLIHKKRELEISEDLFRGLYDTMTSGSAVYNVINDGARGADYIIKSFNKTSLKMEGITLSEVKGKSLFDIRPNIDDYGLIPVMQKVWKTGNPEFFPAKIYKDNKFKSYYENYIFKIPSGEIVTIYNDVTESKRAEEEILEQKLFLDTLINTMPLAIYYKNSEGVYLGCNKKFEDFFSMPLEKIIGKTNFDIMQEKIAAFYNFKDIELLENNATQIFESNIKNSEKSIDVIFYKSIFKSALTNKLGIVGGILDITQIKKIEKSLRDMLIEIEKTNSELIKHKEELTKKNEELLFINLQLKESEDKFRIIFENNPAAVVITDIFGNIRDANKSALKLFNINVKKEFLERKANEFYNNPNERFKIIENLNSKKFIIDYETSLKKMDGAIFYALLNWMPIIINYEKFFLCVIQDITERKNFQENMQKAYNKLKELEYIINRSDIIVLVSKYDDFFSVEYVSDNIKNFGYLPDEFYLNRCKTIEIIVKEDYVRIKKEIENYIQKGIDEFILNYRILNKKNKICNIENRTNLIKDSSGNIINIQGLLLDITEKLKIETEIKSQQIQLIQSGKMAALGQLVAGVTHEINNPNSLISLNTPLLEEYWQELKPILIEHNNSQYRIGSMTLEQVVEDIERIIKTLQTGSERIKIIVNNLKEFSRESGESKKDYYSIKELLDKAYMICGGSVRRKIKNIEFELAEDLPFLYCNSVKIEQVFINLITNAAEAINDCINGLIKINCRLSGTEYIEFHIIDNGEGIGQSNLDKIFDPFFTTKITSGGTGLGLSIVWGIIKEHNGEISVNSNEGIGTEFIIKLPVKKF